MTPEDLIEIGKQLGVIAKQHIAKEIATLEARIAALEARPQQGLKYCGVWQQGNSHRVGDAVTKAGSLWICKAGPTTGEPEIDHASWQLAVKKGRDGKDLR